MRGRGHRERCDEEIADSDRGEETRAGREPKRRLRRGGACRHGDERDHEQREDRAERQATEHAEDGQERRAKAKVGADGGRSFVRGAVGIDLTGSTAPSKWLVVDVEQDTLDAPYSAVYCDPVRPTMTIPLPYGRRRFEFKLVAVKT